MVMSPTNILEVMLFRMSARVSNCCLLYFNANIMCSSTKKASASGGRSPPDPLPGLCPGPRWGTSVPQIPSLPLCPPNNPVRSTPLHGNPLNNYREALMHLISGVCITYYKFPEIIAFQMKSSADQPPLTHIISYHTSQILCLHCTCRSIHGPQPSNQVQCDLFTEGLELQIRPTSSNLAPRSLI